jgi:hypothetical protein
MDVVSQSMSGKMEVSMDVDYNGTTVTTTVMSTFSTMIDFEKFNMREDISDGETMNGTIIVNVDEKQAITYASVAYGNKSMKNCTIEELRLPNGDPFPGADELAMLMNLTLRPFLQKTAKCGGNDGTLDTWKFSANYSDLLPEVPQIPNSPLPSLEGLSIKDGSVNEEVLMSKDHLLHKSTTQVSGELRNGTDKLGSLTEKMTMTVDEVKKGGPSPTDLDPSQFDVECHKINTTIDVQAFLRSPGFARQQLLRIMEASKRSESVLMV